MGVSKQQAGQKIVEDNNEHDAINDRLGHGAPNAARTADGLQSLMAGDDGNDEREDEALEQAVGHVAKPDDLPQVVEKGKEGDGDLVIEGGDQSAAAPADENGKDHQQGQGHGDGDQPGQHQVIDRVDVHGAKRVDFLIDAHGADLRRH